ncbi:MAG: hypothetical protein BGO97_05360 [Micrococcales bacterium 70-64]|nr:MAG: hypothetical protein ABT06_05365 [Leifsonia sp. SCN 70-46]OJX87123.1 MAG: hypothetical protein BGO97_05360 [Micrococcales bacterium 70-64]
MTDPDAHLAFPDVPKGRLDQIIGELVGSAQAVLATESRLRSLLQASRLVTSELELPSVLRQIVVAALELVGARYGAVGVIAPDGSLAQFIHVGMPDETAHEIGHLPEGHGLLGALIEEQQPIRLENLQEDPRSSGFPVHHPAMRSFLGVPIRVRGEVYGNLYLAERTGGPFTAEDEELLVALAGTAGAAIDHARLFDESQRRQRWSAASAEVTSALLSENADDSLAIIVDRVCRLADADLACIALPAEGPFMTVVEAHGDLAAQLDGVTFDATGTLAAQAHESGQPVLSDTDAASRISPDISWGPTLAIPFSSADSPAGVLTVARLPGRMAFTTSDLEMASDFAGQVSVALRLAASRSDRARLAVLEDRGRIARDLHDHVIQRLFGAGLSLQAIAGLVGDEATRARIAEQVDALDAAIAEIRTAIFTLNTPSDAESPMLRHRVVDVLGEMSSLFRDSPRVTFSGPVDLLLDQALADDVVAVVREGLTNVVRHAGATQTSVTVAVAADRALVRIEDDGRGIQSTSRASGTANLEQRARARNGTLALEPRPGGGTVLTWDVPLGESKEP